MNVLNAELPVLNDKAKMQRQLKSCLANQSIKIRVNCITFVR